MTMRRNHTRIHVVRIDLRYEPFARLTRYTVIIVTIGSGTHAFLITEKRTIQPPRTVAAIIHQPRLDPLHPYVTDIRYVFKLQYCHGGRLFTREVNTLLICASLATDRLGLSRKMGGKEKMTLIGQVNLKKKSDIKS